MTSKEGAGTGPTKRRVRHAPASFEINCYRGGRCYSRWCRGPLRAPLGSLAMKGFMSTKPPSKSCEECRRLTPRTRPRASPLVSSLLYEASAVLFGIREGRCSNQIAGVGAPIAGDVTFTDTGVHGAVRGAGLVRKASEVRLDEVFLEVLARVPGDDFIAQLRRKLVEPFSEHIETDARIQ